METLEVKIDGNQQELVVRQGEAPEIRQPEGFNLSTTPNGVVDFYNKRKSAIKPDNSYLQVFDNEGKVVLVVNDKIKPETITITGSLSQNTDIKELGINTGKIWNNKDLELALRRRPHLFNDNAAYTATMTKFKLFYATVNAAISDQDSQRGAISKGRSVSITHGLEESIQLKLSSWSDSEARTYGIDIFVKEEAGEAKFYLECSQLIVDQESEKSFALSLVINALSELPCLHA